MLDLFGKSCFQCLLSRQDGTITSNGEKVVFGSYRRIPPPDLDSGTPDTQKAPAFQGDSSNVAHPAAQIPSFQGES
jgi:hypothetical protein